MVNQGKIKVSYVDHMGDDLRVVNAARISFGSKKQQLSDKDKKLIKYLADHQHMSPFEHNILTIIVECPLYIRSQIHRHRTFSYNEISRRYTSKDLEVYIPSLFDIRRQSKSNRQASSGHLDHKEATKAQFIMEVTAQKCLEAYEQLLNEGVCREQARGILPQNLMTSFYMTGNLRNWTHFIKLREHEGAQSEVRIIASEIKKIIEDKFPVSGKSLLEL